MDLPSEHEEEEDEEEEEDNRIVNKNKAGSISAS